MIIVFNILILFTLILIELVIIKQFWLFNFEMQKVKNSVEIHKARIESARQKIESLNYDKDDLLCETYDEYLIYKSIDSKDNSLKNNT